MRSPIEAMLAATTVLDALIVVNGGDYGEVLAWSLKGLVGSARTFEGNLAEARLRLQEPRDVLLLVITEEDLAFEDTALLREWALAGLKIVALVKKRPSWDSGLTVVSPARRDLGPAGRALLIAGAERPEAVRAFCNEFRRGHSR